ncbi:MAG: 2-oxoacid:acceptor oxidoreductase subunit alpha [Planctomycetota bacterium]|jgi:2-oxoglutarate ferredoxin oxidoreductase subunit alpha
MVPDSAAKPAAVPVTKKKVSGGGAPKKVDQLIVEIVSDSGEGAQKAGQSLSAVSAKMGNGVWVVEIIPAEIQPPARTPESASGIRVRIGKGKVTNMGDQADLVVAFNEQVLYARIRNQAYKKGTVILLENKWAEDPDDAIRRQYADALADFAERGYVVYELPLEKECLKYTENPRLGKNMFVLGMICQVCRRSLDKARAEIEMIFKRKKQAVIDTNHALLQAGSDFAEENLDVGYEIPAAVSDQKLVVMNGNQAFGMGVMASGMEMVAMYPITPATSASHFLADVYDRVGGFIHQAEDEIAAMGFALGASYAGKTACTITSGPGLALKMEFLGLAVMGELPLVMLIVQRGGPSTGLPTKVEQGDLLSVLFGTPGDAPKIVLAPATIEDCFHFVVTARKLAESFRSPVIVLSDANLATGMQPFPRPEVSGEWMAKPPDQSEWQEGMAAYAWDPETGLSPRPIPGQKGGEYVLTGLAHSMNAKVAYDPVSNQTGCEMRSRKLAALRKTLKPPEIFGDESGDLLLVAWGSTQGSVEEAVTRLRADGHRVSSLHLRFLSPLEPGLKEIFSRFKEIVTVEINYSDPRSEGGETDGNRRLSQLARLLRSHSLIDIDCWSNVHGQPISPGLIYEEFSRRLSKEPRP